MSSSRASNPHSSPLVRSASPRPWAPSAPLLLWRPAVDVLPPMVIYTEFALEANIAVAAALLFSTRRRHMGGACRCPNGRRRRVRGSG